MRSKSPVYCSDSGGDNPVIVLLHSLALDHTVWDEVILALGDRFRTVAFDLPGHGLSRSITGDSVEGMADLVADSLRNRAIPPGTIVGLSLGGCVAQALVIRHPGLSTGSVFVDTTAWYGPDASRAWADRARQARDAGLASLADFQLTRWFSESFRTSRPDVCERLLAVFISNDIDSYEGACRALGAVDLRDELPSIVVPVGIVVGEDDQATPPAMAEDIANRIQRSTIEVIPGCKHLSAVERPIDIAATIRTLASAHL
jgi:3-oxoadipate enol-lactonase